MSSLAWQAIARPREPFFAFPALAGLPSVLSQLWDSVLRAVPKKKQSHSRKRMRQLAGKALPDVIALSECPGCGGVKRSHHLCPRCVNEIREMWKAGVGTGTGGAASGEAEAASPGSETTAGDTRGSSGHPSI
ncbi:hypothetical protein DRE_05064 [Drechslerella stenobrocha 248]|uniref:Large ribosomal subunit protein bL32m n=1 Tax=Drechslerella stenobrocha 248 TaxID=1043628 RepID=W7HZS4_9PEZI|nr:hypothetical protein DRE_05064 [Drechslerella stenobrocha 248]